MEHSKQARAQPAPARGSGLASRPLPSADPGTDNWRAKVPTSAYLIVPMGGQPAQVGASSANGPHLPGARPATASRVSLRPPQQVLSVHRTLPSTVGKKVAASPKVQMLEPLPSQVSSASKGFVQKGPLLKAHSQFSDSETVRSKFRENLGAALCVDSDQQIVQKSAGRISPFRSASENKHADCGTLRKASTCIALNEGKADTGTGPKSFGSINEQQDRLSGRILGSNMAIKVGKDANEQSLHVCLGNEVSGNSTVVSDEALQGHGPFCPPDIIAGASESISLLNSKRVRTSDTDGATVPPNDPEFKRTKTSDGVTWDQKDIFLKGQSLALRIEEELFKLCGGVSKKYKEKGRSLLFNLKDKSNPVLRGRILSGEITPKCLCSMTTEELASKELAAWRLAKAEELGKMVVRPNREVNIPRLVRKTHKGEFHVEVDETDSLSFADELRGDMLSHIPSKSIEGQIKSDGVSVHREDMEPDNTMQDGFAGSVNSSLLSNLECAANKRTVSVQGTVAHDMKYTENLPDTMSLDDFVEAPDSGIPLECHSTETAQDDPNFTDRAFHTLELEKNHIGMGTAAPSEFEFTYVAPPPQDNCQASIRSPKNRPIPISSPAKQTKEGCLLIKSSPEKMDAEIPDTGCAMQSKAISLWKGTIQLNLSSLINVVAIFKSGEKPSTNEWCRFVEIKGTVRLNDFQDFLEQLPRSRSRAVTVTELRWKEGSHEGRQQFMQTIGSYIADERVGLVKPAKGVELYICPGKTAQILSEYLPKEHSGILTVTGVSVIGVFVWRRPCVSTETLTRHEGSKVQSMPISRKQQAVISSVPTSSQLTRPASQFVHPNEHHCLEYDATDDVPPSFGQGVVKDDNDVYGYGSLSNRSLSPNVATPYSYGQHGSSPPMDLVRQLVLKYGGMNDSPQPWDHKYDDLPEWDPSLSGRRYNATQWQQQPVLSRPLSQDYTVPHQHAMTMQRPWNHPSEALSVQRGWQSRPQWQDIPQQTRFVLEPDMVVPERTSLRATREPWFRSWKPHYYSWN